MSLGRAILESAHDHAGIDGAVRGVGAGSVDPGAVNIHSMRLAQTGTCRLQCLFIVLMQQRVRAAQGGVGDLDVFAR